MGLCRENSRCSLYDLWLVPPSFLPLDNVVVFFAQQLQHYVFITSFNFNLYMYPSYN